MKGMQHRQQCDLVDVALLEGLLQVSELSYIAASASQQSTVSSVLHITSS